MRDINPSRFKPSAVERTSMLFRCYTAVCLCINIHFPQSRSGEILRQSRSLAPCSATLNDGASARSRSVSWVQKKQRATLPHWPSPPCCTTSFFLFIRTSKALPHSFGSLVHPTRHIHHISLSVPGPLHRPPPSTPHRHAGLSLNEEEPHVRWARTRTAGAAPPSCKLQAASTWARQSRSTSTATDTPPSPCPATTATATPKTPAQPSSTRTRRLRAQTSR